MPVQSEAALENGLIATLQQMNYEYVQIEEEKNLRTNFKSQLEKHNRKRLEEIGRTEFTEAEFEKILIYLEGGTRFEKAKKLRDLFPLELDNGERLWVEFLNRTHWCQNEFQVSHQITVEGRKKCRYDVTILINGLPLVQIELKRRGVELKQAYNQIQRYHKTSFHGLFDYVQLFVISNGVNTRYFANNPNSGYKFTFNWTDAANVPFNELEKFATSFFDKCTLGKIIGKYIVLHEGDKCLMVLRPYQFYAVEKILDRVKNSNNNGYIWHTTGAGKTLTSFKAAQLVAELDDVDKVMFVVDRHDLDTQTQSEYEAFEPGAVDSTDNTDELVKRLHGNSKIIITTIQKLNAAVSKQWYSRRIEEIRHARIVMIFDECHRSHFGDCHKNIVRFFDNTQIFGFTGTPIFVENAVDGHTTKEIFGNCLHKYLIKDAIADENVLGFLVEYYHGNADVDNANQNRMTEIAKFILNNFNKSTFDGEFDALFAVQSVSTLIRYYKIFKSLNPKIRIGAVFTYASNSSQDDALTGMNTGSYVSESTGEADELQAIMDDYNDMFGTSFTTENFRAYYDDINLRMKKKKTDMKPLDLCLVVGMFLTGFDSKKLNTLYVDKNMDYHGLLQAFSRTNRVLNEKKRFGKIVCFRDLKSNVDASIKLFSNSNNLEDIVRPPFNEVKKNYQELTTNFLEQYPTPSSIDLLQSEKDKKQFILAFRDVIKKHAEIQVYDEFEEDAADLGMTEQQFMDFRSKYLDIYDTFAGGCKPSEENQTPDEDTESTETSTESGIDDIDFCLELLHSDIINVTYILELIADLNPYSADYKEKRTYIIDTMIKDAELRNKAKLIDGFIQQNVDDDRDNFMARKQKFDGTSDLEERLNNYITTERNNAVDKLAKEEGLDVTVLNHYLSEYDYLQKEQPEIIQEALKEKHLGLIKKRKTLTRILDRLKSIIRTFSWE
ncbi:type I restriction endonuclease subunit R, EcoR124 family [Prevotella melaninogenica]|uniref:type I restriction endonuclease subunit R, EcoR124 family n=1 Tax=Prevotella melaninogenica TaxID=28132 RepID=UPI0001AE9F73|nr:type I restriction endonuclease subunit R [Prevotella melaninogenica]ADK96766.1 type I site-specific deoxyribonuclease, HsdR family [Prevotella melaninogenica ATCC 25845]ASE18212.1 type I restriction endonuclease subunit R [Prevotella melaninogenica]UEB09278.1 type I restriction endonuclease subunit R [Prevotella melaninogenica]